MLHPPQEGSDRILTYGTLLDVLWQMYHAWITYGTVRRIASTLDRLGASMKKHQENYFSGREIQMTSMPRQRGVTEFQPKRALSNSNPNG